MKTSFSKKHKAFTLIEYMVAITIGLILIAGLTYLFLGMKRSTETQSGITHLQENGRFALYFLSDDIQNAGWADVETSGYGVYTSPAIKFGGSTIDGGDASSSDRITVRYASDEDCVGGATGGIAENSYFVEDGQLKCTGSSGSTQPLISNIDVMHFWYGVDTNGNSSPNKFVRANELSTGEQESIAAVKVVLVLSSEDNVHQTSKAQSFNIIGEAGSYTVEDRKLRKIFTTTVTIPNKPAFVISS